MQKKKSMKVICRNAGLLNKEYTHIYIYIHTHTHTDVAVKTIQNKKEKLMLRSIYTHDKGLNLARRLKLDRKSCGTSTNHVGLRYEHT